MTANAICLPIDASGGVPSFAGADTRVAFSALMTSRVDRPLGAHSGVTPGSDPVITLPTTTSYRVTPFTAVIDPATALAVGPYLAGFTVNQTGSVNAADATNARIDRLDLVVPDDPVGNGNPVVPTVVYTPGVATSSPQLPAAPARSFPLATINVPKATTGNPSVTPTYPYCAAAGGIALVSKANVYPAHPFVGQYVDDAALGLMRWDGAKWAKVDSRNPPCFWGATGAALAIVANTNIPFPVVEDPYSGWNAAAAQWVVPRAGRYQINSQAKWGNGTGPSSTGVAVLNVKKNGTKAILGPNADAVGNFQGMLLSGFVRCAAGDTLALQAQGAFTTQDDTPAQSTYVTMLWVSD